MAHLEQDRSGNGRRRLAVAGVLSLASLLLFLVFDFEDIGQLEGVDWSNLPVGLIARYAIAMGLGGALAGYILSGFFGRFGFFGWLLAFVGGLLVATIAGVLGSAIGLAPDLLADGIQARDLIPIGAGALVLPLAVVEWPIVVVIWVALIFTAHLIARRSR